MSFEDETLFTKGQVSEILAIDERTVDRYLSNHSDELKTNGYRILKGQSLKSLKNLYVDDMSVVDINPKSPSLGVFTFRALLNIAMLVTESDRAKIIRSRMLDIVIDVIAEKSGGHTKYINQRDQDYFEQTDEPNIDSTGWIPKGWEKTSFESMIKLIGGGTPKTNIEEYWNGDTPWFSVIDAPNDSDVFVLNTEKHAIH